MARLQPNMKVIKMTGFAIAFTYFGAFAIADAWEMTVDDLIKAYPIQFYLAMAVSVTLFLQGELQNQKEALQEKRLQENKIQTEQPQEE